MRWPSAEDPLRLAVVDDNALFRRTLARLIAREPRLELTAEADSGRTLGEVLGAPVELLLLDLEVGQESGFDLLSRCRAETPDLDVILLTGHDPLSLQGPALDAGARDCRSKTDLKRLLTELATGDWQPIAG